MARLRRRAFLERLLRPPVLIRACAMTCASVAILICASISSAFATVPAYYESNLISETRAAIRKCDYDKWEHDKREYELALDRQLPVELSYPFPCYPVSPGTNRSTTPTEPAKLYSVGRPLEPKLYSVGTQVRPPKPFDWSGFYISGNVGGNFNHLRQQERFGMTNAVTNEFSDSSQGIGFGFGAGYLFQTGIPNILVGASASFDVLNQDTLHTFPGTFGFFLGETSRVMAAVKGQVAVAAAPGFLIYGEAGPAIAQTVQKLNFSGPVTTVSHTAPGLDVGIGFAYQPPGLQIAGHPLALFGQINRVFVQQTTSNNAGSPNFIYLDQNDITKVSVGVRMRFNPEYDASKYVAPTPIRF